MEISKQAALDYHSSGRKGKIEVVATKPCRTQWDLSLAYTPGVARVCEAIAAQPRKAWQLTIKGNSVAVVSDGTVAAGSLLRIREVPIEAACRRCGRVYPADVDNYLCPGCGQADVEIVAGDDIMLTSVVGQVEEQAEEPAAAEGEPKQCRA